MNSITMTGMREYSFSNKFSMAKRAALEFAVSKMVSTSKI